MQLRLTALTGFLLALALSSCSGNSPRGATANHLHTPGATDTVLSPLGTAPEFGARGPDLPLPAELAPLLPAPRGGSYVPADLVRSGADFLGGQPSQRVSASGDALQFSPQFTDSSSGFGGLAFALYSFTIPDYDGNPAITIGWSTMPAGAGEDDYLALANWDTDRWDWFAPGPGGSITLPSLEPYRVFGGNLLACVARSGTEPSLLEFVRIGSIPPQAALSASTSAGLVPLSVSFDASASTDSDGTIAEYRWDPEGDGTFSLSSGTVPGLEHQYSEAGEFVAAVRVIDNQGVYCDAQLTINALSGLNFSYGSAASADKAVALLQLPDGDLLAVGEQFEINVARRVTFVRFRPDGELVYAIGSTLTGNDFPTEAVLAGDGFIYTCGFSFGTATDGFVQKWSQQGNLIWSNYLRDGSGGNVGLAGLRVSGGDIYVCGTYTAPASSFSRTLTARLNTEGQVQWARGIGEGTRDFGLADITVFLPSALGDVSIHSCGRYEPPNGNTDAFYVTYDTAGNLGFTDYWGTSEEYEYAGSISVSGINNVSGVYIAGHELVGGRAFFSKRGGPSIYLSTGAGMLQSTGMQGFGGQLMQLLRLQAAGDQPGGFIAGLNTDAQLVSVEGLMSASTFQPRYLPSAISSYFGSGLLLGGSSTGALPQAESASLDSTAGSLQWWDTGSSDFAIALTAVDSMALLEDLSGFSFDRNAADEDMHVMLLDR